MEEELKCIGHMGTWTLVPLPLGKSTIPSKWVYKRKPISDTHARLKAQLVILDNLQKHGIDFNENFLPIVKWATLHAITTIIGAYGWTIFHMDVDTAFLNSPLTKEVYMRQPPRFIVTSKENYVCLLHNSLYNLWQSSHAWYDTLHAILPTLGWL